MKGKGRGLPSPPGKVEVRAEVSLMLVAALSALGCPLLLKAPAHFSCMDSDDTLEALGPGAIH